LAKTKLKTKPGDQSVRAFIAAIPDTQKRNDCFTLLELMKAITKEEPEIWGGTMVGFGTYHYKYESGREGDWFLTGFSPRKHNISIYIMTGFSEYDDLMKKLGTYKTGVSCLYIKKLEDINKNVLKKIIQKSVGSLSNMGNKK